MWTDVAIFVMSKWFFLTAYPGTRLMIIIIQTEKRKRDNYIFFFNPQGLPDFPQINGSLSTPPVKLDFASLWIFPFTIVSIDHYRKPMNLE
jgi:hypothetical protein